MKYYQLALVTVLLFSCGQSLADNDCWVAGNFSGKSATSFQYYTFSDDKFADGMLICFIGDSGNISGNDLDLIRMGSSTLIGWSSNEQGLQAVNTYQIDRENMKVLITQSRIGTTTITSILPDYAAAFVGDVTRATD